MNRHAPDVAKRRVCDVEEARLFIQCQTIRQTGGRQSRQPLRCRMQAWTQTPDPGQIGAASTIVEVERSVSYSDNTADERISPNNRANNRSGGTCCRGRQCCQHMRFPIGGHPCDLTSSGERHINTAVRLQDKILWLLMTRQIKVGQDPLNPDLRRGHSGWTDHYKYSDHSSHESPSKKALCKGTHWSKHLARINSLNHPCFLHQLLLSKYYYYLNFRVLLRACTPYPKTAFLFPRTQKCCHNLCLRDPVLRFEQNNMGKHLSNLLLFYILQLLFLSL